MEDPEFRAKLAEVVASAQEEADGRSATRADHGLAMSVIDRTAAEFESLRNAGITALQLTLDHGHRLVLVVTTVLGFVVPAAVFSKAMHPGWLLWSVVWLGASLIVGVARLYAAQYSWGFTQSAANAHYRHLFGILSGAFTDARAFTALGVAEAAHAASREPINSRLGYYTLALDVAFFALFVSGIVCACGGMIAALGLLAAGQAAP